MIKDDVEEWLKARAAERDFEFAPGQLEQILGWAVPLVEDMIGKYVKALIEDKVVKAVAATAERCAAIRPASPKPHLLERRELTAWMVGHKLACPYCRTALEDHGNFCEAGDKVYHRLAMLVRPEPKEE
jgi:hypothetical protein